MQTESLISRGLLKSGLRRFWPSWAVLLVVFVLLFLVPLYAALDDLSFGGFDGSSADSLQMLWEIMQSECTLIVFAASIAVAILVNGHLFSAKSATFVGALPQRRRTTFVTSYLTGFAGMAGVLAVVGAALACLHFALPLLELRMAGEWFALMLVATFFFYSFAQLMCQLAGTRSVALLLYSVASVLAVCVEVALRSIVSALQYGLSDWSLSFDVLSPLVGFADYVLVGDGAVGASVSWPAAGLCCALALVFAIAAGVLYRRRSLEMAGESVAWPALRPVLKYLAGIATALLFASVACLSGSWRYGYDIGAPSGLSAALQFAAAMAVGGFLGVLFAEMIMSKSTRVLRMSWRGACVVAVAGVLFVGCVASDALGVASRVPDAADVAKVEVSVDGEGLGTLSSPEAVAELTELHRAVYAYGDSLSEEYERGINGDAGMTANLCTLKLSYTLNNGDLVVRSYPIVGGYFPVDAGEYDDSFLGGSLGAVGPDGEGGEFDSQGLALLEQLARIVNTPEALKTKWAALLEGDRSDVKVELYYDNGDADGTLLIPARQATAFLDGPVATDILEHDADGYDPRFAWAQSTTQLNASLEFTLDNGQGDSVGYIVLDAERTPAVNAWIAENYPQVKLSLIAEDEGSEDE